MTEISSTLIRAYRGYKVFKDEFKIKDITFAEYVFILELEEINKHLKRLSYNASPSFNNAGPR